MPIATSAIISSFLGHFRTSDLQVLVQNSGSTKRAAPYGNVTVMKHSSCYNPTSNLGAAPKNRHFGMGAHHQRDWEGFRTTKLAISLVFQWVEKELPRPSWGVCTTPKRVQTKVKTPFLTAKIVRRLCTHSKPTFYFVYEPRKREICKFLPFFADGTPNSWPVLQTHARML